MKMIIDIRNKGPLSNNDILIYKDGRWEPIDKLNFLGEMSKQIKTLKKEIEEVNNELEAFKDKVNKKLSDYHDILNVLTKGEE